jgi:hypothetical protein
LKETAAPLGLAQHVSQTYGWNRVADQYDRWITSVTG